MTSADDAVSAARGASPRRGLATLLILASACCFGVVATFARLAYDAGSNPLSVVLLRHGCIVLVVGATMVALGRSLRLPAVRLRQTLWMGLCLLAMALGFMSSVAYIPVSLAALILYTNPIIVAVLMSGGKSALLVGAFAGLCLALGPPLTSLDPLGLALAFTAAVGVSLAYVFGGPLMRSADVFAVNFYTNLWIVLPVAAWLLLAGGFALPSGGLGQLGLAGAIVASVAAIVSWFIVLRLASPVRIAVLFNLDAVVNIVAGVIVLDESLDAVQVAGIVLVLACLIAMALRRAD
jgi:drug/metabolite transporter (DMT)-like permease